MVSTYPVVQVRTAVPAARWKWRLYKRDSQHTYTTVKCCRAVSELEDGIDNDPTHDTKSKGECLLDVRLADISVLRVCAHDDCSMR